MKYVIDITTRLREVKDVNEEAISMILHLSNTLKAIAEDKQAGAASRARAREALNSYPEALHELL